MEEKRNLRPDIYESLVADIGYAVRYDLYDLVWQTHGSADMAYMLGAITFNQFWAINAVAVMYLANGGADRKKKALEQFEKTEW